MTSKTESLPFGVVFGTTAQERKKMRAKEPHAIYRIFNKFGELLYIGASCDPVSRLYAHDKTQQWATDISHIEVTWLPCRDDALAAEKAAILTESPKWNFMYNAVKPNAAGRYSAGFRHDDKSTWENVSGGKLMASHWDSQP